MAQKEMQFLEEFSRNEDCGRKGCVFGSRDLRGSDGTAASQAPTSFSRAMLGAELTLPRQQEKQMKAQECCRRGERLEALKKESSRNIGKARNSTNTKIPQTSASHGSWEGEPTH